MDQTVHESIDTLQSQKREMQALLFFSFFKIPLSNPRLESQAMCTVFVFQGLSAPLWLQSRQRLAEAVGQAKLHHKQRYQLQNLKTLTRSF